MRTLLAYSEAGTRLWTYEPLDLREIEDGTYLHVDPVPAIGPQGTVYLGGRGLIALAGDGTSRWVLALGGEVATPTVGHDDTVYVRAGDALVAVDASGIVRWQRELDGGALAGPSLTAWGALLVGSAQHLYAVDARDGSVLWSYLAGAQVGPASIDGRGTVYVSDAAGVVHALEPDGTPLFTADLDADVAAPPVIGTTAATGRTLYVVTRERSIVAMSGCEDRDLDGRLGFEAEACPNGEDRCDHDARAFTAGGCACGDADGDGFGVGCDRGPDCDDGEARTHPGALEACGDEVDSDCSDFEPPCDLALPIASEGAAHVDDALVAWTGSEMLVWGRSSTGTYEDRAGALYDPVRDRWRPLPDQGAPRWGEVWWTGEHLVVWSSGTSSPSGVYDVRNERWKPMSGDGRPDLAQATWAAAPGYLVIWGTTADGAFAGARYDAARDQWLPMSGAGAPPPSCRWSSLITETELLLYRMSDLAADGSACGGPARYDPVSDVWSPMTRAGSPFSGAAHAAVAWTGARLLAWVDDAEEAGATEPWGAAYDPVLDTWTPLAPGGPRRPGGLATELGMLVRGPHESALYVAASDRWVPAPGFAEVHGRPVSTGRAIVTWYTDGPSWEELGFIYWPPPP